MDAIAGDIRKVKVSVSVRSRSFGESKSCVQTLDFADGADTGDAVCRTAGGCSMYHGQHRKNDQTPETHDCSPAEFDA
jgi:hypothetical protein